MTCVRLHGGLHTFLITRTPPFVVSVRATAILDSLGVTYTVIRTLADLLNAIIAASGMPVRAAAIWEASYLYSDSHTFRQLQRAHLILFPAYLCVRCHLGFSVSHLTQ